MTGTRQPANEQHHPPKATAPVVDTGASASGPDGHYLAGTATLERVGRWRFPVFELTQGGEILASLGRPGWIRVLFGRGQRIELADGSRWRIKSVGAAGNIAPAIFDSDRRKIAISSVGVGNYGINGRDYGAVFYQAEGRRFGRANKWIIRRHDEELAVITRYPPSVEAAYPVHLGAVLVSFALIRYGILGESAPRLALNWK